MNSERQHQDYIERQENVLNTAATDTNWKLRFLLLLNLCMLPFGGHFFRSSFSSLQVLFLKDPALDWTSTDYGFMVSKIEKHKTYT